MATSSSTTRSIWEGRRATGGAPQLLYTGCGAAKEEVVLSPGVSSILGRLGGPVDYPHSTPKGGQRLRWRPPSRTALLTMPMPPLPSVRPTPGANCVTIAAAVWAKHASRVGPTTSSSAVVLHVERPQAAVDGLALLIQTPPRISCHAVPTAHTRHIAVAGTAK